MNINPQELFKDSFPDLASRFSLKPFQEKVIRHVVDGHSTVAIMPTGGGKSLIYWVAAQSLRGTCLIVSPLIALIDEQSAKLTSVGFKVMTIHGGISSSQQTNELIQFANGESIPDFIFVSPERIATDGFFDYCIRQQKDKIPLFVIDEIHCISQWGFDFRPFYKRLPDFLNHTFNDKWPTVLGLTATINPKELHDISADFKIPRQSIFKDEILLRFDIDLKVEKYSDEDQKENRLWELLSEHQDEKTLVYLYRKYYKRGVEDLCQSAIQRGFKAVSFHGDMSGGDRQDVLEDFRNGISNIVFATNAFGMGIDISDIRVVIHYMIPESIEQYYQEVGRAGRDQKGATAYILYSNKNVQVRRTHFIDKSLPSGDEIEQLFTKATNNQVGIKTLQYFAEEDLQSALPYFLDVNALTIEGKGFTSFKAFKDSFNPTVDRMLNASRTGMVIPVMRSQEFKTLSCVDFFDVAYKSLVEKTSSLLKSLDKCIIIKAEAENLSQAQKQAIELATVEKRKYKHALLDYLVYVLDNFDNSQALHQEIGRYLGVDRHMLNKIHKTESGIWVRSKSEVIIANILFRSGIEFRYEEKLFYEAKKWKEPDFTIKHNGKTWYWEHLGLLGDEKYNTDWHEKKRIYEQLGITSLITTKESSILSDIANEKIKAITAA